MKLFFESKLKTLISILKITIDTIEWQIEKTAPDIQSFSETPLLPSYGIKEGYHLAGIHFTGL